MNYSIRRPLTEALRMGKVTQEGVNFVAGEPTPAAPPPQGADRNQPVPAGTISMTFRIPTVLAAGLTATAAERKTRRERPFSQQDIVTEALAEWLQRHSGPS